MFLLDTHVLLWWRQDDPRLPARLNSLLERRGGEEIYFSLVSLWEIAIKRSLGKLRLDGELGEFARDLQQKHRFRPLGLETQQLARLEKLPRHHGDPFDRMLISQALEMGATAVTDDPHWKKYALKLRW